MLEKEYLTVNDISKQTDMSSRNVRRIINAIEKNHSKELIHKDNNQQWQIHHILMSKFKPQRKRLKKYYALTIDPTTAYSNEDIHKLMKYIVDNMETGSVELNYVIEKKKGSDQRNHIHAFVRCSNKKRLIELIRMAFSTVSYHTADVFDLYGWESYITKENNNITTLKN